MSPHPRPRRTRCRLTRALHVPVALSAAGSCSWGVVAFGGTDRRVDANNATGIFNMTEA